MMKAKQLGSLLTALCLTAGMAAACGNEETVGQESEKRGAESSSVENIQTAGESDGQNPDSQWMDDPAEVTWMLWSLGEYTQAGVDKVEAAVNEITLDKINVHVTMEMMEMGSYMTQMPMYISGGDKIDLITTFPAGSGMFSTMAGSGQLLPLEDYLEDELKETVALLPDFWLDGTVYEGQVYGIPSYRINDNNMGMFMRKSVLDEAGIDGDSIKTLEDIEDVYAKVKELHPEMKMISSNVDTIGKGTTSMITGSYFDGFNKFTGVILDGESSEYRVVNLYDTDEFRGLLDVLQRWNEKGYVDQDIAAREEPPAMDPTVFSWGGSLTAANIATNEANAGEELVTVKLTDSLLNTQQLSNTNMAIPVTSTEPEAAARLMNLLFTDADLKNLVNYGIEGENYTFAENGGVAYIEGSGYNPQNKGIFGNDFLSYPTEQEIALNAIDTEFTYDNVKTSPLLGFMPDENIISNEVAALLNVTNEYEVVEYGMVTDEQYQEMLDKMKANGLDAYLAEIQKQLDEWLEAQNHD